MLAAPERVGSRGQQALSEMAGAQHLALTQRHVSEVITGGAAPMPSEGLKPPVVQETPLLHQPVSSSTNVLIALVAAPWQAVPKHHQPGKKNVATFVNTLVANRFLETPNPL